MDLKKIAIKKNTICVQNNDKTYIIEQDRFLNNQDYIFDIYIDENDMKILNKIFAMKHITLKDNAEWALGIVTGNNKKFISSAKKDGYEEIFRGKDIERFSLKKTFKYIKFTPKEFQQTAPESKYRAKEKLVYRFISKYLIFAYDDKQRLILNSANILIPKLKDYPIKVILALFNSSIYQFIFQKKFASIKVLRNHIEQLPLPLWNKEDFNKISNLVDKIILSKTYVDELDDFIITKFSLNNEEIKYIREFVKK